MSAGLWNTTIEAGAYWSRTITYKDQTDTPIAITAPAYMELRDDKGRRIVRLDDGAGITVNGAAGQLALELEGATTGSLPAGIYAYDLWVTAAGKPVRLLAGKVTITDRVSKP